MDLLAFLKCQDGGACVFLLNKLGVSDLKSMVQIMSKGYIPFLCTGNE